MAAILSPEELQYITDMRREFLAMILAPVVFCQPPRPSFEVVSIKPTPPGNNRIRQDYCTNGGRFSAGGMPVSWLLGYAFHLRDYQMTGAPAWTNEFDSAYDIEGKPPGTAPVTDEQCRLMVRSVFFDRFKLAVHSENRDTSVYLLTVARNGPKVPKGDANTPGGGVKLNGTVQYSGAAPAWPDGWNMSSLANYLSDFAGRPVLDRTDLTGKFGITLNFSAPNAPHREGEDFPDLFIAVQEQLGLKIEPGKAPIEVMVIDHMERPSSN